MFFCFVEELARRASRPLKEHWCCSRRLTRRDRAPEEFYYLARSTFVKDEGLLDRFDQVFAKVFKGLVTD